MSGCCRTPARGTRRCSCGATRSSGRGRSSTRFWRRPKGRTPRRRRGTRSARRGRAAGTRSWRGKGGRGCPSGRGERLIAEVAMRILALDVGTSSVKAAVLDAATTQPVGPVAHVAYPLDFPTPDAAAAGRQAAAGVEGVEGVGLSVLTPALVLLDAADRPLLPIWTHLDRRARPAARQVWAAVGPEFLATTGNRPLPGGMTAVCWKQIVRDSPYLHRRLHSYLHANGWLALRLTGERAFDPGNASVTGLFHTLGDQQWSPRWCEYFEVPLSALPRVLDGPAP